APSNTATRAQSAGAGATTAQSDAGGLQPVPPQAAANQGIPQGAMVERNANVSLQVKAGAFDDTINQVLALMRQMNGYVSGSAMNGDSGGLRSGSISIRVPADHFQDSIDKLRKLGTVDSLNISGNDHSDEYVDLQA